MVKTLSGDAGCHHRDSQSGPVFCASAHRMPSGHADTTHRLLFFVASTQGMKRLSPSIRAVAPHCS
jgi:hypothetical protein